METRLVKGAEKILKTMEEESCANDRVLVAYQENRGLLRVALKGNRVMFNSCPRGAASRSHRNPEKDTKETELELSSEAFWCRPTKIGWEPGTECRKTGRSWSTKELANRFFDTTLRRNRIF